MARCNNILTSLGTALSLVVDITFLSKMGDKKLEGVKRRDKIWHDVITF